ncbi:hypothetical protein Moror_286 [Moniliophthora roreri MCA 2997]|uniref:Uncharacterized protein n=2 Tax=Moniliophthora roreri TaxID=221103 RepID=V2Z2P9_MONRO|nr:hypothetical protein Moror_286 [Moniliophthora roreri MCA 2997]KAI3622719.1 hypothetical protein WG66_015611 [Moniliophthora roreri]
MFQVQSKLLPIIATALIMAPIQLVFGGGFHIMLASRTIGPQEIPDIFAVLTDGRYYDCKGFQNSHSALNWGDKNDLDFSGDVCGVSLDFSDDGNGGGDVTGSRVPGSRDISTCTSTGLDQATFDDIWLCTGDSVCN